MHFITELLSTITNYILNSLSIWSVIILLFIINKIIMTFVVVIKELFNNTKRVYQDNNYLLNAN